MLTNLSLSRFKPFGSRQTVRLAPVTLIYGPNSAGKSSLIQSILLLKQSLGGPVNQPNRNGPLNPSGPDFNFGSVQALIHRQRPGQAFSIGLGYQTTSDKPGSVIKPENSNQGKERLIESATEINFRLSDNNDPNDHWIQDSAYRYKGEYGSNGSLVFRQRMGARPEGLSEERRPSGIYSISRNSIEFFQDLLIAEYQESQIPMQDDDLEETKTTITRALNRGTFADDSMGPNPPVRFDIASTALLSQRNRSSGLYLGRPISFWSDFQNSVNRLLRERSVLFEEALSKVMHLGPLRSPEERGLRFQYADAGQDVGKDGANASGVFSRTSAAKQRRINQWFKRLSLNYTIQVENRSDITVGDLLHLTLKTRDNDPVIRTSTDVGFGFTQIMPIIVQGIVSEGKTICVEQPEIHLHPKLQAELTDFLIDTSEDSGNQWIVETHSELLIRRLQRRIKEGRLASESVCVLYVDPVSSQSSRILELRIDADGDFMDEWPSGFFDESFDEVAASFSLDFE